MKFTDKKILFASHNPNKIVEFSAILNPLGIKVVSAEDAKLPEPEETGSTFDENALLKAQQAARITNLPAVADDSGICIAALDGKPGINSKRWVEECGGVIEAFNEIKGLLEGKGNNSAYIHCSLVLCWPDGKHEIFHGRMEGNIVFPPRGNNNFGYDPIFQPEGYNVTYGEMSREEKLKISHRGQAVKKLLDAWFK